MAAEVWAVAPPGPVREPTLWRVDLGLDERRLAACRATLSEAERQRADRFRRAEDRRRFLASHSALRYILGSALGVAPAALAFETGAAGKPELAGAVRGRLRFNLSHSGSIALIGLAPDIRIGVDVERIRPIPDWPAIARSHFSTAESAALAGRPAEVFYACWTRKEAFVKALGIGLSLPLDRFTVTLPPAPPALVEIDGDTRTAASWTLLHVEPAPGHIGAAAIDRPDASCTLRAPPQDWIDGLP